MEINSQGFDKKIELENSNPTIDLNFKPNPVHLTIIKEAQLNNDVYDRKKSIAKIRNSFNEEKIKNQMIMWNQININTLVKAGYLTDIGQGKWQVNPLVKELKKAKSFELVGNHIKLLEKNHDGIITLSDLKKELAGKRESEINRQKTMMEGVIKKLYESEYLERVGKGQYRLTDKAHKLLSDKKAWTPAQRDLYKPKAEFKLTAFDRFIKEVMIDGRIDEVKLKDHKKGISIAKRIKTLEQKGLIKDNKVTNEFEVLLVQAMKLSKDNKLTIEMLSIEQLKVVKDMRLFLNLSKAQIAKYIYDQDWTMAKMDLDYLVRKKVLKIDEDYGVYIFDVAGIALSNQLYPDAVKYHTKLHSRKEELEHDMLVYTAFNEWSKGIIDKGGSIVDIKNDRQMRKDDATQHGHMIGSYPDLRVSYKMPKTENILKYDIEIDCGYDQKTIASKVHGITSANKANGFGWYCKTASQALKAANTINKGSATKKVGWQKSIKVYWMDDKMNLHVLNN